MNTKFERDNYGLRLNCIAANDNERALLSELFDLQVNNAAKRGLVVTAYPERNTLTVHRPTQYINRNQIYRLGFRYLNYYFRDIDCIRNKKREVYIYERDNKTIIMRGNGVYTIYVFDRLPGLPSEVVIMRVDGSCFELRDGYNNVATWNFSEAKTIYRNIKLISEIKDILNDLVS